MALIAVIPHVARREGDRGGGGSRDRERGCGDASALELVDDASNSEA